MSEWASVLVDKLASRIEWMIENSGLQDIKVIKKKNRICRNGGNIGFNFFEDPGGMETGLCHSGGPCPCG